MLATKRTKARTERDRKATQLQVGIGDPGICPRPPRPWVRTGHGIVQAG